MVTARELQRRLAQRIGSTQEARWVVEEVVAAGPSDVELSDGQRERVEKLIARRLQGEPLQYVLGHWPFRRLELTVDRRALIPRPETEELVDVAHRFWPKLAAGTKPVVVDLGTGTGALALALADELSPSHPGLQVWAVDDDEAALSLAAENLRALEAGERRWRAAAGTVRLRRGRWWEALPADRRGRIDLAVANPPYVGEGEWTTLDRSVRHYEPRHALVAPAGPDGTPGLAAVAEILSGAPTGLSRPAALVMELAPPQVIAAERLARASGADVTHVVDDLSGRPRFVVCGYLSAGGAG